MPCIHSESRLALVDCNHFYAACERLFAPHLEGQPLVVLSNNDGCVIARSPEAKALGIAMGTPWFQLAHDARQLGLAVRSSNYGLYGDLSRRVMTILADCAPRCEVYSIDECFLEVPDRAAPLAFGQGLVARIARWTGLPVAVGLAPTKTLAKLANRLAKQGRSPDGAVLDWSALPDPDATLASVPVEDIWGIGARWGQALRARGIGDARTLRDTDPRRLRREFGVILERLVWELRGQPCLPLALAPPPRQQLQVSRTFGAPVSTWPELRAALLRFASRAGAKLRGQGQSAQALILQLRTVAPDRALQSASCRFAPTQDTQALSDQALTLVARLYRPERHYGGAGLLLPDLIPATRDLLEPHDPSNARVHRRLAALDAINRRYGRDTLRPAGELVTSDWPGRARFRSSFSTTRWDALPCVQAR